ncbi:MAG: hypothetical protein V4718_07860 [Pseudomonadota bacterium]
MSWQPFTLLPLSCMRPAHNKFIVITLVLLAAYFASIGWGVYRITSSEVFPLSKKALAEYLAAKKSPDALEPYQLRWWSSWNFRTRSAGSVAEFQLCTPARHCYLIKAWTANGKWVVTEVIAQP